MRFVRVTYNVQALAQWEVGFVRLPDLRMPLEFVNLKLLGFTEGSGRPLTDAWLCFLDEVCLSSPHCRQCPC